MSEISIFQTILLSLPFIIIAGSGYLLLHSHQLEKNKSECWICNWRQWIFAGGVMAVGIVVIILAHLFSSNSRDEHSEYSGGRRPSNFSEKTWGNEKENIAVHETRDPNYFSGLRINSQQTSLRGDSGRERGSSGFGFGSYDSAGSFSPTSKRGNVGNNTQNSQSSEHATYATYTEV